MPKVSDILGMNAREQSFGSQNSTKAKSFSSSKFATKILLMDNDIPTAKIHGLFLSSEDVNDFDWESLERNFVIKPTNGNAGKGIIAFRRKHKNKLNWTDTTGEVWDLDAIKLHCFDILDGQYSTYGTRHQVIVEERIPIHPIFFKYSKQGTPDVRVIVYNNVPIMAMLRLPTKESEGRANLHQGAIGVGVDMATGITTNAITGKGTPIKFFPETKFKLNGIKIPDWTQALTIAVKTTQVSELKYSGIDLFFDKEKGPLVVEINANPGLSIQLANNAGLRRRLERVEALHVIDAKHGVKIGQALFAVQFSDKIKSEGLTIITPKEKVTVYTNKKNNKEVNALINTGRYRSVISKNLAEELAILHPEDLLWFEKETRENESPIVEVKVKIKDRNIKTTMIVSRRLDRMTHKVEIGRKDLAGFLVGE